MIFNLQGEKKITRQIESNIVEMILTYNIFLLFFCKVNIMIEKLYEKFMSEIIAIRGVFCSAS